MWKIIFLLLLMVGFIWVFNHQDELLQKAEDFLKTEKTISKVNGVSQEKERMLMDAQRKALEY